MFVGIREGNGVISNWPSKVWNDVWLGSGGGDLGESYVDRDAIVVQSRRLQYYTRRTDDHG